MANTLLTPLMMQREVLSWLPKDALSSAHEQFGDLIVYFESGGKLGEIHISQTDRALSLDDIKELYKPAVDDWLINSWTLN